jgi:hypothetical protein
MDYTGIRMKILSSQSPSGLQRTSSLTSDVDSDHAECGGVFLLPTPSLVEIRLYWDNGSLRERSLAVVRSVSNSGRT